MLVCTHLCGFAASSVSHNPISLVNYSTVSDSVDGSTSFSDTVNTYASDFAVAVFIGKTATSGSDDADQSLTSVTLNSVSGTEILHNYSEASSSSHNVIIAFWLFNASYTASTATLAATFPCTMQDSAFAAVWFFTGGDNSDHIGATGAARDGDNNTACSTNITTESAASYILAATGVGGECRRTFTQTGSLTEIFDNSTGDSGSGFMSAFIGHKTNSAVNTYTVGTTAVTCQESVCTAVEIK